MDSNPPTDIGDLQDQLETAAPRRVATGRFLILSALAAPFLLVLPQQALIPSWYEASLYLAGIVLLLHGVAVVVTIVRFLRRRTWSWPARIAASLGLLPVAGTALIVTADGASREGTFMCDRVLEETAACPGGGQALAFVSLCIAGNPKGEVFVRPNVLPFMHRVPQRSAADACAALRPGEPPRH